MDLAASISDAEHEDLAAALCCRGKFSEAGFDDTKAYSKRGGEKR